MLMFNSVKHVIGVVKQVHSRTIDQDGVTKVRVKQKGKKYQLSGDLIQGRLLTQMLSKK